MATPIILTAKTAWHQGRRRIDRLVTDRRLGISTAGHIPMAQLGLSDAERVSYEPSPWRTLRRVLGVDEIGREDVLMDVGAGKGRVVIEAAVYYEFRRVIGLELSPELARAARANVVASAAIRCPEVRIVVGDAATHRVPDDVTVIFLYNPFRGAIFRQFLGQVLASLDRRPRRLRIVYRTPLEHLQLIETGRFRLVRECLPLRPTAALRERGAVRLYETRRCRETDTETARSRIGRP